MNNLSLALMAGIDIPIPELQITVHQPTIKEIAYIGDSNFFIGVQCLNIQKSMIPSDEILLGNTNNFQIFMTIMLEKETLDKKEAVKQVLSIVFPNYKVSFTPQSMIFSGENIVMIDERTFPILQEVLSQVFCARTGPAEVQTFNPANKKAQEIANKILRGRQRVAASKESSEDIFSQYVSTLTVGLNSMSLNDCLNLTMYQLFDLMERYSLYISWDLDIKSRLAGGKSESKPDNWMKNIH